MTNEHLHILKASLSGDLYFDSTMRALYATDASIYREMPLAVAMPRTEEDILQLIRFANQHKVSLVPRAAGTSLAGQCVGNGIIVDTGKYLNQILSIDAATGTVRVQPGVVRDALNFYIKPHGLFFGPNTSTANRAMIGGMVGNNSCGSYSIVYGSTRDHVLEVKGFLSDGTPATFGAIDAQTFVQKCELQTLEGQVYRHLRDMLSEPATRAHIRATSPDPRIPRRNTGYALDLLLPFFGGEHVDENYAAAVQTDSPALTNGQTLNLANLIAGSEGTLFFLTEITLHCDPLPPNTLALMCVHFDSLQSSLKATVTAMQHRPRAVELMDDTILQCTKANIEQRKNRFFVQGDPAAILVIEVGGDSLEACNQQLDTLEAAFRAKGEGISFPRVYGKDINKVWALRAAGLGVLSNIPDAPRPIEIIEDTAVRVEDLPAYIAEFAEMMAGFGRGAIYYAHAGAGELHLRPMVSLRTSEDRILMRQIAEGSAHLVKKYRGSLSGEHGDGRVRGEFVPLMVGEETYQLFRQIKETWDPHHLLNPGKIVDAPPMDQNLRYEADAPVFEADTVLDFGKDGILAAAERCNGSADCRKLPLSGGTMCPSYMASRNEKESTRARANILREFLSRSTKSNKFDHKEIYEVMDLCLSCKGCTSECPSNVDMASLKAEFLHQYYKSNGIPLRSRAIANISRLNSLGMIVPGVANAVLGGSLTSGLLKKALGVAPKRSLPLLARRTFRRWFADTRPTPAKPNGLKVWLFADEFTNYNDVTVGQATVKLLTALGYEVALPQHVESGRAYISKGLLNEARELAIQNVSKLKDIVTAEIPLVGIEPSAILSFRDEYPRMVGAALRPAAETLAKNALTIEEFIIREADAGRIQSAQFTAAPAQVLLHGHCHQKSLSSIDFPRRMLELPANYRVEVIPSGCCGMAGSFGYEAEHYDFSMQVGEMVLFPAVRSADNQTIIAAPGTSCRHQIADGTGRKALHPVQVLAEAVG